MKLVRPALVAAFVVAVVLQPGAADADTLTRADAVGDVARSQVGSSVYTPAPARVEGDIWSTRVTHGRLAIWVHVHLRELTTTSNGNFHRIAIKSDRRFRSVEIDAFPGHWAGTAVTKDPLGRVVSCPITQHIGYLRNVVTLKMPRSCLGGPRWVRVGMRSVVAGAMYAYADNGRATGYPTTFVYGPRIHR